MCRIAGIAQRFQNTHCDDVVAVGYFLNFLPFTAVAVQPRAVPVEGEETLGSAGGGILATFIDPDAGDTHTAVIDWGDGTVTAGIVDQAAQTVSGSHTFAAVGTYMVTITVTDNGGGVGSDTLQIVVSPNQLYLPVVLNNP